MELSLAILGLLLIIVGIAGSFLPVLPGPPLSWLGLLLLYLTDTVPMNYWVLVPTLVVTIVISVLDYVIPSQGTKRFGGSKYGIWGTNIGLVIGIIAPIPAGFVIGPFLGAFIGELIYNSSAPGVGGTRRAFRAATGSFIGFLASTFLKFVFCMILFGIYCYVFLKHASEFFG